MIRRATPDDAGTVAELLVAARDAAAAAGTIPPLAHGTEDVLKWATDWLLPECEVWIAEQHGAPVGFLALQDDWIEQLYLDPAHTGRRIGTALLDHAKQQRPRGLQLFTFQSNDAAQRFYERHGFTEQRRTDGENEEGAPDILYAWPGTPAG